MIKFQTLSINNVKMPVNFKADTEPKDAPQTTNENNGVNTLDNPMETVGRSQVNFKAKTLSNKDLNFIAKNSAVEKLSKEEIGVLKKAITQTMKDYGSSDFKELFNKSLQNFDSWIDFNQQFMTNVQKINPKADVDKLGSALLGL